MLGSKVTAAQETSCSVGEAPTTCRQTGTRSARGQLTWASTYVGRMCQAYGRVPEQMVGKFGPDVTVRVAHPRR
jgi:hypothetical protein